MYKPLSPKRSEHGERSGKENLFSAFVIFVVIDTPNFLEADAKVDQEIFELIVL